MEQDEHAPPRRHPASPAVLVLGVSVVAVGVLWLIGVKGFFPSPGWIWTATLGVGGVGVFAAGRRVDKATLIAGGFLLACCGASVLRHLGRLTLEVELPVLVIALGLLILLAQHPRVPVPRWYGPGEEGRL